MRRVVAGLLVAGLIAACGGGEEEKATPTERLVDDVAAGGKARERAVERLAQALNRDAPEVAEVDPERADRAVEAVIAELTPLIGDGPPVCGSWAYEPKYGTLRYSAEVVLDLAGRAKARESLSAAMSVRDPYVAAWAIRAANQAGAEVDDTAIARAAADDYARSVLLLGEPTLIERIPEPVSTVEARARADMTQWLVYPTELGCQPADLETMGEFPRREGRYFVFRFRAGGGEAKDADVYQAGVSGPWGPDGALAEQSATFSDFKRADSDSAAGHLRRLVSLTEAAGG